MWGLANKVIDSVNVKQISRGDRSSSVTALQTALLEIGRGLNIKNSGGADGSFGSATEKDVVDFQRLMDLQPDGIVGVKTWSRLSEAQNVQRESAFPPQNLVSYSVSGSTSRKSPSPAYSPVASVAAKRPFPSWAFIPIGLAIIGIFSGIILRRNKTKRKRK